MIMARREGDLLHYQQAYEMLAQSKRPTMALCIKEKAAVLKMLTQEAQAK
jgi:hypothetical protein